MSGHTPESSAAEPLGGRIRRVAIASTAAQGASEAISLLQTIVIARLLGPAEVGLFAAGTVVTTFLAEFTEGGLRAALVNRGHEIEEAAETVFWGTIVTGTLMSLGALAAAPVIGVIFSSTTAGLVAAASAGGLLIYSLGNVPEAFLQREFNVKRRLIVGPAVATAFAAVSISLAVLGFGVWSLVIASYASFLTGLISVWILCGWRPGRARPSLRMWRELARYGFPLVLGNFSSRLRALLEAVVVGRVLGTVALGHYRYGLRIARIPVNAMVEVFAYALFPAFSRIADDPPRLRDSYLRALGVVTICAVPVSGLLLAIGVPLVVVVLGEPWRGAGFAVAAMAGLGLGKALSVVSEEAIKGAGRTKLINRLTTTELLCGLGLLLLVIPLGLVGVGLAVSGTAITVGVLAVILARPVVGARVGAVVRAIAMPLLAGAIAAGTVAALEHLVLHSDSRPVPIALGWLVAECAAFGLLYLGGLALLAPDLLSEVAQIVRQRRTG